MQSRKTARLLSAVLALLIALYFGTFAAYADAGAGADAGTGTFTSTVSETKESGQEGSQDDEEMAYVLDRVVILSRHNIRSPLSGKESAIGELTDHEWFEWTSRPGELSLRGAMLETTMGQYFRLWLEKEGLFPENYIPEDGAVRFYANGLQRTQATAHYFSTGLLPVAVVPIERHVEYNEPDSTFLPLINFMTDEYRQDILDEIKERGAGDSLMEYTEELGRVLSLLMEVTDMEESKAYKSGKYGDFLKDESLLVLEEGNEPKLVGPLKTATSIADALVLQYYEEPDDEKAAFGHDLTEEDWKLIGAELGIYSDILFTSPLLSVNLAHPMLQELYSEFQAPGRKLSFLCGHDSTIRSVLAALDAEDYTLENAIESVTPIGAKVVFERWLNEEGEAFYKVNLVYQSVGQLRSIQPLSLEIPPEICPLSFKGVESGENGMIPEKELMNLFESAINRYDELEEYYTAEYELDNAA